MIAGWLVAAVRLLLSANDTDALFCDVDSAAAIPEVKIVTSAALHFPSFCTESGQIDCSEIRMELCIIHKYCMHICVCRMVYKTHASVH